MCIGDYRDTNVTGDGGIVTRLKPEFTLKGLQPLDPDTRLAVIYTLLDTALIRTGADLKSGNPLSIPPNLLQILSRMLKQFDSTVVDSEYIIQLDTSD